MRLADKGEGDGLRQGVLDVVPVVGAVSAVGGVQSTGGHPGGAGITGVDDDNALPVMLVSSVDE